MLPSEAQAPIPSTPSPTPAVSPERGLPARMIPSAAVRHICGGVSKVTLHRWMKRPDLAFPRPVAIGQRNYWHEAELLAWLKAREVAA